MSLADTVPSWGMPIGYVEPEPGRKLVHGVADPMGDDWEPPGRSLSAAMVGATQLSPQPFVGPGSGRIFTGFGHAPTAATSAPLIGLNCT